MKSALRLCLRLLLSGGILLAACAAPGPTPAPTAAPTDLPAEGVADAPDDVLYLNLVWHQHQPLYYKNDDGVYTRPWARVHATKDYYDMASTVAQYPGVHVTFNLTPVLMRQLDDFAHHGAKDVYWVLAEMPAAQLTDEEKAFILSRFFDANWDHVIPRYPRYAELLQQRGGSSEEEIAAALQSFSEQDLRDLQMWFNLAWMDPDFLAEPPLKALVERGRDFSESDKAILFSEIRRLIGEVIPLHRQLQEAGQIEITTTPYAHPILPLINDTAIAAIGNPSGEQPRRFTYPLDAEAHLTRSVEMYEAHFGVAPRGLWPGEGAVAQPIVPLAAAAGYQWMASGEPVLAKSIGIDQFTRDFQDTVQQADALYRPYFVQGADGQRVMIVFRDLVLSDKIGFTYSGTNGEAAAADFMARLENIRARLKEEGAAGPHLVSVILDGENAWEHYDNDGKDFLNALYRRLSESQTVKTITPSDYLSQFPEQRTITYLFPGAWFSANYDTWIGEPEETQAWYYLLRTRAALAEYDLYGKKTAPSPEALEQARDYMYLAEGSDWFWWYGKDQESGQDEYFDAGFRSLLEGVYTSLGESVPTFVNTPIIPARTAEPQTQLGGLLTPVIDGLAGETEWQLAARHSAVGGVQARAEDVAADFYYGVDSRFLYLRIDAKADWAALGNATVGVYIAAPRFTDSVPTSRLTTDSAMPTLLGFGANVLVEAQTANGGYTGAIFAADGDRWQPYNALVDLAVQGSTLEMAMPLSLLGDVEPGDDLKLVVVVSEPKRDRQLLPSGGLAQLIIPDLGTTTAILTIDDAPGDDNGAGQFSYPTDGVFAAGAFDIKQFVVGYDDKNMVFKFVFYGPVTNPWGSPNQLAIQTLDVYVDKDPGAGTGARLLLPGRNAALQRGNGWEYAIWAEGWTPQFVAADAAGGEPKQVTEVSFKIIVNPGTSTVTIRVPRAAFGEGDPTAWGYAAAVMSQEGYPSAGVWRVRDGQPVAGQWRFGGVPDGTTNYPRIFDIADTGDQAAQLAYTASTANLATLTADDFAQVGMLRVGE